MTDWRDHANCKGVDPDVFFPSRENPTITEVRVRIAKVYCQGCPVKPQCLEWALLHERHGIWGGTTPTERRHIRRDRRKTAA